MNRLLSAAAALLCVCGLSLPATAQMTTITAATNSLKISGAVISTGTVLFTPVDVNGIPIAFETGGGGLNSPGAFSCAISAGALSGCSIPDSALTSPPNLIYQIQVSDTSTGNPTSGKVYTLQSVIGVTGATWALDHYGPPARTSMYAYIQASGGPADPTGTCTAPAIYTNTSNGGVFTCVAGAWLKINGLAVAATASSLGTVQLPAGQTSTQLAKVAITGAYGDLSGAPSGSSAAPATSTTPGTVQLATGQTSSQLATVATTGSYNDLSNKPAPGAGTPAATATTSGTVQLATGQTSSTLAKVATTGVYSDLSGTPALGTAATMSAAAFDAAGLAAAAQAAAIAASDTAGAAAAAQAAAIASSLQKANNLSDVATPATARANLGLGTAAVKNMVGSGTGGPPTTPSTPIPSGHAFVSDGAGGAADMGYAAATVGTAGQLPVSQGAGVGYAPQTVSGDCTFGSTGVMTCLPNTQTAGAGGIVANTFLVPDTSSPTKYITAPVGGGCSGISTTSAAASATFRLLDPLQTWQVLADGAIAAGHIVTTSTATPGYATDSLQVTAANISTNTRVCGVALTATTAAGQLVTLRPDGIGARGANTGLGTKGGTLYTNGDSTFAGAGALIGSNLAGPYAVANIFSADFGMPLINVAVSATSYPDQLNFMVNNYPQPPATSPVAVNGSGNLVVIEGGINDGASSNCSTTDCLNNATGTLLAQSAWAGLPQSNWAMASNTTYATASGAWTASTGVTLLSTTNGTPLKSTTNGNTITFNTPVGFGGTFVFVWGASNSNAGTFTLTQDATPVAAYNTASNTFQNYSSGSGTIIFASQTTTWFAQLLTVTPNATHQFIATVTSATNAANVVTIVGIGMAPLSGTVGPVILQYGTLKQNSDANSAITAAYDAINKAQVTKNISLGVRSVFADVRNGVTFGGHFYPPIDPVLDMNMNTSCPNQTDGSASSLHLSYCGQVKEAQIGQAALLVAGYGFGPINSGVRATAYFPQPIATTYGIQDGNVKAYYSSTLPNGWFVSHGNTAFTIPNGSISQYFNRTMNKYTTGLLSGTAGGHGGWSFFLTANQATTFGTATEPAFITSGGSYATAPTTVTYSATPAFNAVNGVQVITLTGNVTSSTLTNLVAGQRLTFQVCQDATGSRTFVWPTAVHGGMTIGSTASTCSMQSFNSINGTTLVPESAGVTNVAP